MCCVSLKQQNDSAREVLQPLELPQMSRINRVGSTGSREGIDFSTSFTLLLLDDSQREKENSKE